MYKLLIVDDEYIERSALKFIIENNCPQIAGFDEASTGREAVAKALSFKPDIIMIDIKMPGINGIEASREIKRLCPGCRIVFLTAYDYFDYAQEAIKIGVEDFIVKPAPNEQVIEVINRITASLDMERVKVTKQVELENRFEQIKDYLENELVYSLLTGDIEEEQIKEYLSAIGIKFEQGFGAVISINFENYTGKITSPLQKNMIKKRCMEKIEELFCHHDAHCLMCHINNNLYLFVMSGKQMDIKVWSIRVFDEICTALKGELWVNAAIGIGDCCASLSQVSTSFLQAKKALNYAEENRTVTHIDDARPFRQINEYPVKKEKLLCEKIILGEEDALVILDEIMDWIMQHFESMDDLRRKVYEIIVVVSRAAFREVKIKDAGTHMYFKDLESISSRGELRHYVREALRKIMNMINATRIDRSGNLIEKVMDYIKKNYMKDITLDDMAGMVGLSSYYFSKMFKHYQKVNFIDYLTEVRIGKAKELLGDSTVNIKEVSSMVGYSDPNYFTRVFKRTEGITPTEYRNKKMLSAQ